MRAAAEFAIDRIVGRPILISTTIDDAPYVLEGYGRTATAFLLTESGKLKEGEIPVMLGLTRRADEWRVNGTEPM